jgi:hypothetical protein
MQTHAKSVTCDVQHAKQARLRVDVWDLAPDQETREVSESDGGCLPRGVATEPSDRKSTWAHFRIGLGVLAAPFEHVKRRAHGIQKVRNIVRLNRI